MSDMLTITEETPDVIRLTLDRPAVHNAFDDQLINDIAAALDTIAGMQPRVLVLAANGKSFSAGADLNWMKKSAGYTEAENQADALALAHMLEKLDRFPATTVAAVQGAAFGGGVGLVACCDIAIASEKAIFSLSEVKLGLIPATISPFVIAAMGAQQARRYFATGERFDAATAEKIGLVHELAAPDALESTVSKTIDNLLLGSPDAQRKAQALIDEVAGKPIDEALLKRAADLIALARASDEGREGVSAFLEKRKPSWIPAGDSGKSDKDGGTS